MVTEEVLEKALKLLSRNSTFLTGVEKQRKFIINRQLEKHPCPQCRQGVSTYDAAPGDWDGISALSDNAYTCPYCHTPLLYQLAFFGGTQSWIKIDEKV